MQCSICLDDLSSGPTLACGHRFHAACLARLAGANGTTPTRRGALTACPNCRTVSRVALATPVAAFGVGDRVDALFGQRWYPGVVDAVVDGGRAFEIKWDDGDEGEVRAAHVRAAPAPARTARPAPVVAPPAPPPAPPPRVSGPPPAPRAIVPRARSGGRPSPPSAPLPPATRSHVASTSSAWVAVCTDLLDSAKDCTNLEGHRFELTAHGFRCGPTRPRDQNFHVTVPPEFPCYYDLVGKDYATHDYATTLSRVRKYLDAALALARAGSAYRTEAEYKPRVKTSRFTGVLRRFDASQWAAQIRVRGSSIPLGDFDDEEDAARAYDAARVKYKGAPTVNFPGEAPSASVLAALPAAPAVAAPPRRSGRAPAPKVIADAPDERSPAQKRAAKRPLKRTGVHVGKYVEGAIQKANGKWRSNNNFPGREFDDLDEYRAAKRQRAARRGAYSDQIR